MQRQMAVVLDPDPAAFRKAQEAHFDRCKWRVDEYALGTL